MDGDGNTYFYDRNGKIFLTEKIKKGISPITVRGLDYNIAAIPELIREHRTTEALRIIKTILAMKASDFRIVEAQEKALRWKQEIMKRHGSRYRRIDEKASPLLFSNKKGSIRVINENMYYALTVKGMATVMRNRTARRPSYRYHGILLGVTFEGDVETSGGGLFDCLMAIDAEKFAVSSPHVSYIEKSWDRRIIPYRGKKERVLSGKKAVLYRLTGTSEVPFSGYEGYILNGPYGYVFRVIVPVSKMNELDDKIKDLALSIKISSVKNR